MTVFSRIWERLQAFKCDVGSNGTVPSGHVSDTATYKVSEKSCTHT
jgi:hypothetical protein